MRYCTYCGMPMEEDDLFCTRCGKPVQETPEEPLQEAGTGTVTFYEEQDFRKQDYQKQDFQKQDFQKQDFQKQDYQKQDFRGQDFRNSDFGSSRGNGLAEDETVSVGFAGFENVHGSGTGFGYDAGYGYDAHDDYEEYGAGDEESAGFSINQNRRVDYNRAVMAVSAVVIVAVLVVLLAMLIRPRTEKDGETGQESVAVYEEEENGTGGQNLGQGSAQPVTGANEGAAAEPDEGTPAASQAAPADGNGGFAEAGGNAAGSGEKNGSGEKSGSADNSGRAEAGPANGTAGAGNGSGYEQAQDAADPSGWTIDEDGNEVYYPAEGEEYRDNDQTVAGGDYAGGSGNPDLRTDDGQGVQTQSAEDASQTDGQRGEDALQGYAATGTDSGYLLPESSSRYYSRGELESLDDWTLQMAINEIYARHGRKFNTPEVREYFESKSWYRGTIDPDVFDGNEAAYFNQYEMRNRELMARIRAEREEAAGAAADRQR